MGSRTCCVFRVIEALHSEVERERVQLGESFVRGWQLWREAWLEFWTRYGSPASWTSRVWGGVVDEAERFREGLERWRTMMRERGAQVSSPVVPAIERPTVASAIGVEPVAALESMKPIAIAAAVIVAVGGAVYFFGGAR